MLRRLHFELRYLLNDTPWDSGETPPEVYQYLEDRPPGRAIDLGCGTGTNVIALAQRGWEVVGIDVSRKAIAIARKKAERADVEARFVRGDAALALEHGRVQGPFDLALDIGCMHALEEAERPTYTAQLSSLVKPGGTYLLYSFLGADADTASRWPTEAEIQGLVKEHFKLVEVEHGQFRERASAWFQFERRP